MKYLDEYRDAEAAHKFAHEIARITTRPWSLMEVCGGQTHAIVKFGLDELLPKQITLIHGPGCPVCVTAVELIDKALEIAARPEVIFCSFGDMLRVPGSTTDLLSVKARGGDVRIIYSPLDAVKLAEQTPAKEVVFFGVGFETTAPTTAMAVYQAAQKGLKNFSLLVSHVLVPPAMEAILSAPDRRVQAFLAAGHVCAVMGYEEYVPIAAKYHVPIVVTGFEPLDILQGVLMCIQQLESGRRRGRKPIQPRRAPGGQSSRAAAHPRSLPGHPAQMAGHRRDSPKRPGPARRLRGLRRRAQVRRGRPARGRADRMSQRPGIAGQNQAPRMSRLRHALHPRASARRHDGLLRRRLCRLLPLPPRARQPGHMKPTLLKHNTDSSTFSMGKHVVGETRNPKPEIRRKSELRNPNIAIAPPGTIPLLHIEPPTQA